MYQQVFPVTVLDLHQLYFNELTLSNPLEQNHAGDTSSFFI